MNSKKWSIIIGVLLVVLLVGASVLYNKLSKEMDNKELATVDNTSEEMAEDSNSDEKPTHKLTLAPDFTVYDREGNPYKLSDFLGKPVVLNFWASWCGPCKMEMPDFQLAYEEYGENIHFLFVNLTNGYNETLETATDFIDESGYTFPVYYDTDVDATMTYGVYSVPVTYFIDAEGYLIANGMGALDLETIKRGITMIYEED